MSGEGGHAGAMRKALSTAWGLWTVVYALLHLAMTAHVVRELQPYIGMAAWAAAALWVFTPMGLFMQWTREAKEARRTDAAG